LAVQEAKLLELRSELALAEAGRQLSNEDIKAVKALEIAALEDLHSLLNGAAAETRAVLMNLIGHTTVTPCADKLSLTMKLTGQLGGFLQLPVIKLCKQSGGNVSAENQDPEKKMACQSTGHPGFSTNYSKVSLGNVVAREGRVHAALIGHEGEQLPEVFAIVQELSHRSRP
jgi:hypothetical protein